MLKVLAALIPGIAVYVWFFGAAILVQIALASAAALAGEAAMLKLRGQPVGLFLADGSALVTAWLIALTFPPIAPSSRPCTNTAPRCCCRSSMPDAAASIRSLSAPPKSNRRSVRSSRAR